MMAWTSSGSRRSDIAVKPDTSVNMTVTCLRSPSRAAFEVRIFSARCLGVYAAGEAKRWDAERSDAIVGAGALPAAAAPSVRRVPHSLQNLWPGALSFRHAGQIIPAPIYGAIHHVSSHAGSTFCA